VTERWLPWQFTVPDARRPPKSAGTTAVHVGGVTLFWGGRDEYGIRQAKQRCHKLLWQVWVGTEAVERIAHGAASVAFPSATPVAPMETASSSLEVQQVPNSAATAAADSNSEPLMSTATEAPLLPPSARDVIPKGMPTPSEPAASCPQAAVFEPTEVSPAPAWAKSDKDRVPAESVTASQGGSASEPSETSAAAESSMLVVSSVFEGAVPSEALRQSFSTSNGAATASTTTTLEVALLKSPSSLASSSTASAPVDVAPSPLVPTTRSDSAAPVSAATEPEASAQPATTAPAGWPGNRRRTSKSTKVAPAAETPAARPTPVRPIPGPIPRISPPVPAAAPTASAAPNEAGLPYRDDIPYRPRKRPHVKTEPPSTGVEPTPTSGEAAEPTADNDMARSSKRARPKEELSTSPVLAPAPAPAQAPAPAPKSPVTAMTAVTAVTAVTAYVRPPPAEIVHPIPTSAPGSTATVGYPAPLPSHATPAAGSAGRPTTAATAMMAVSRAAAAAAAAAATATATTGGGGVPQVLSGPLPSTPAVTSLWLPHVHGDAVRAAAAGHLPGLATVQIERAGGLARPDLPWPAPGSTVTVNGSPIRVLNVECGTVWLQLRLDVLHQGYVLVCRTVSLPGGVPATPSPWCVARFHDDHVSREVRARYSPEPVVDALYHRRRLPNGEVVIETLSRLTQENAQRLSAMQPAHVRQGSVYCTSVGSAMHPLSFELLMFTADTCYEFALADAVRAMDARGPAEPAHIFVRVRTSETRTLLRPGTTLLSVPGSALTIAFPSSL